MKLSRLASLCQILIFIILIVGGIVWGVSAHNRHLEEERQQRVDDAQWMFWKSMGME